MQQQHQSANLKPFSIEGATVLRNDTGARRATVFIDGAVPGVAPYCGGAHIWGGVLDRFAADGPVAVIDSLSAFNSGGAAPFETIDAVMKRLMSVLRGLDLSQCHLVSHDAAGLAALLMACDAPELITGVTAVSSAAACPTRDGEENLTLAYPLAPRASRQAQRWTFERISYGHQHIDDALLDACVAAAGSNAWQAAAAKGDALPAQWASSVGKAKNRLYEIGRTAGVPVPVQVVWGTHDPLVSMEHGLWLFRILAQRQPATHFHLLNRTGALPFREEPDGFHQAVAAFIDGTHGH